MPVMLPVITTVWKFPSDKSNDCTKLGLPETMMGPVIPEDAKLSTDPVKATPVASMVEMRASRLPDVLYRPVKFATPDDARA